MEFKTEFRDVIHKRSWWKGFWVGTVGTACVWFILFTGLFFLMHSTIKSYEAAAVSSLEEYRQVSAGLTKCKGISEGNYDVATRAQEENRALRELVVEYQAQIQKGQAPANLAEFLLKLLVK